MANPTKRVTRAAAILVASLSASAVHAVLPPWTVEATPIELALEAKGRLVAARKLGVRLNPKAFRGSLVVAEVLVEGGPVEAGEVLLKFETAEIEEALERARIELEEATLRLDLVREEQQVAEEASLTRVERTRLAAERAAKALEVRTEIERDRQLRGAQLRIQGNEDSLTNQQQELDQLEQMYAGTSLASETKDIVLERSRRAITRAKESLALARIDHELFLSIEQPDRDRDVEDRARWSAEELRHLEVSQRLDAIRRRLTLAESQRKVADLADRVEDLESDLEAMTLLAPATGLLTTIAVGPGDTINPRQSIAEVMDASSFAVETTIGAQDLGWLASGAAVAVTLPAVPGIEGRGSVTRLSRIGTADGRGAAFPMRVEVPASDPRMLIGLEAKVAASTRTDPVVAVPNEALREDGDRRFVMVLLDGRETEREVVPGRRGTTMIEILSGLEPGDRVVLPEPESKGLAIEKSP